MRLYSLLINSANNEKIVKETMPNNISLGGFLKST